MTIDGPSAGITHKRQDQEARQDKPLWIAELGQPDHHIRVPLGGMRFVGAEQSVPPGQVKAIIAVGLPDDDRVMDPMHVRRNNNEPEHRDGVMQDVLGIHHKIQRRHTDEHLESIGQGPLVE